MGHTFILALIVCLACTSLAQAQIVERKEAKPPIFFKELAKVKSDSADFSSYPETVRKGIDFLKSTDLAALPFGRTDIDGDRIYLNKQEYETRSGDKAVLEAHRKYIDIQLIIKGKEQMACVPLKKGQPNLGEYSAENDVQFFPLDLMPFWKSGKSAPCKVTATAGWFAIFEPCDIHSSGVFVDKSEKIQKIVVKCRVE